MSDFNLSAFAQEFAVPLLTGGRCTVSDPLGREGLDAVRHSLSLDPRIEDAVEEQFEEAALTTDISPAPFDEDAGTFLYAAHELFASAHPQSASFYARSHLFCIAANEALQKLPRTYDPARLLTRHLLLSRTLAAKRTDVDVKWWTGGGKFYGTEPPTRLTAWPGLRRVNIDRVTTPMWKLALADGDEETRVARVTLMTTMLDLSPLSRLLLLGENVQKELGFSLMLPMKHQGKRMSPIYLLDDDRVARAVTDTCLERGIERAGPPLGLAVLQAVRESAPPLAVRWAAELCVHFLLTACLVEAEHPNASESEALRQLINVSPSKMGNAERVYWSVVQAVISLDGKTFSIDPIQDLPPAARAIWDQAVERLSAPQLVAIAAPLAREFARRLPPLSRAISRRDRRPAAL